MNFNDLISNCQSELKVTFKDINHFTSHKFLSLKNISQNLNSKKIFTSLISQEFFTESSLDPVSNDINLELLSEECISQNYIDASKNHKHISSTSTYQVNLLKLDLSQLNIPKLCDSLNLKIPYNFYGINVSLFGYSDFNQSYQSFSKGVNGTDSQIVTLFMTFKEQGVKNILDANNTVSTVNKKEKINQYLESTRNTKLTIQEQKENIPKYTTNALAEIVNQKVLPNVNKQNKSDHDVKSCNFKHEHEKIESRLSLVSAINNKYEIKTFNIFKKCSVVICDIFDFRKCLCSNNAVPNMYKGVNTKKIAMSWTKKEINKISFHYKSKYDFDNKKKSCTLYSNDTIEAKVKRPPASPLHSRNQKKSKNHMNKSEDTHGKRSHEKILSLDKHSKNAKEERSKEHDFLKPTLKMKQTKCGRNSPKSVSSSKNKSSKSVHSSTHDNEANSRFPNLPKQKIIQKNEKVSVELFKRAIKAATFEDTKKTKNIKTDKEFGVKTKPTLSFKKDSYVTEKSLCESAFPVNNDSIKSIAKPLSSKGELRNLIPKYSNNNLADRSKISATKIKVCNDKKIDFKKIFNNAARNSGNVLDILESEERYMCRRSQKENSCTKGLTKLNVISDSKATANIENDMALKNSSAIISSTSSKHQEKLQATEGYHKHPFFSRNKDENTDLNNKEWDILRKLRSDTDRYHAVRRLWRSIIVPDPNVNLTTHVFRWTRRLKGQAQGDYGKVMTRKRLRENDSERLPHKKRARLFQDLSFNRERINKTKNEIRRQYSKKINSLHYKQHIKQGKITKRYHEYLNQLENVKSEVETIHKFYKGLPDQNRKITQLEIVKEQRDIDQVYDLFMRIYDWDGLLFYCVQLK